MLLFNILKACLFLFAATATATVSSPPVLHHPGKTALTQTHYDATTTFLKEKGLIHRMKAEDVKHPLKMHALTEFHQFYSSRGILTGGVSRNHIRSATGYTEEQFQRHSVNGTIPFETVFHIVNNHPKFNTQPSNSTGSSTHHKRDCPVASNDVTNLMQTVNSSPIEVGSLSSTFANNVQLEAIGTVNLLFFSAAVGFGVDLPVNGYQGAYYFKLELSYLAAGASISVGVQASISSTPNVAGPSVNWCSSMSTSTVLSILQTFKKLMSFNPVNPISLSLGGCMTSQPTAASGFVPSQIYTVVSFTVGLAWSPWSFTQSVEQVNGFYRIIPFNPSCSPSLSQFAGNNHPVSSPPPPPVYISENIYGLGANIFSYCAGLYRTYGYTGSNPNVLPAEQVSTAQGLFCGAILAGWQYNVLPWINSGKAPLISSFNWNGNNDNLCAVAFWRESTSFYLKPTSVTVDCSSVVTEMTLFANSLPDGFGTFELDVPLEMISLNNFCQYLNIFYGFSPYQTWGSTPSYYQSLPVMDACNALIWGKLYNILPFNSFGTAPSVTTSNWNHKYDCYLYAYQVAAYTAVFDINTLPAAQGTVNCPAIISTILQQFGSVNLGSFNQILTQLTYGGSIDSVLSLKLTNAPLFTNTVSMQSDGNICFMIGSCLYTEGQGNGPFTLQFDSTGNLVAYDSNHAVFWQSYTSGRGLYASFGSGIQLTIYDANYNNIWQLNNRRWIVGSSYPSVNTPILYSPQGAWYLQFQSDGNLCMFRTADNYNGWCSRTGNSRGMTGPYTLSATDQQLQISARGGVLWSSTFVSGIGGLGYGELSDQGILFFYNNARVVMWRSDSLQWNTGYSTANVFYSGSSAYLFDVNRIRWARFETNGQLCSYVVQSFTFSSNPGTARKIACHPSTPPSGPGPFRIQIQGDSNICMYDGNNNGYFCQCYQSGGDTLLLGSDGALDYVDNAGTVKCRLN